MKFKDLFIIDDGSNVQQNPKSTQNVQNQKEGQSVQNTQTKYEPSFPQNNGSVFSPNPVIKQKTFSGEIYQEHIINLGVDRDQSIKYTPEYINYVQTVEENFNNLE